MKNFVLFICVATLFSFTTISQNIEEVLTSGKWYVESIQEKGKEPEVAEDKNDEWLVFYADGKLEENQFGEMITSKWQYVKTDKLIKKIEGDGIEYLKVIEISSDKLIVEQLSIDNPKEGVMITYTK